MRSLVPLAIAMLVPVAAFAEDWTRLTGPEITAALTARVVAYGNGGIQNFHSDGSTLYESGPSNQGRWKVDGNQYCSLWPPQEHWACYDVEREARGLDLRFIGQDGTVTPGRYIDLQ